MPEYSTGPNQGLSQESRIIFLAVPLSLRDDMKRFLHRHEEECEDHEHEPLFTIDDSIPLPVELGAGNGDTAGPDLAPSHAETFDPENLSWEMILSAMIKVTAAREGEYPVEPHWPDYYRRFVLAVKPEIYRELSGAAIIKAKNGDYDMALEIIGLLEGLFPGMPQIILNRALILEDKAEALERAGREEAEEINRKAQEAYEQVLSREPVLPEALFNAGFFFLRRREYHLARDCFSAYLPLSEDDEKNVQAQALIKDIEDCGLDDNDFLEALGLIRSGDNEKGLLKIRNFLEKHPTVWNGWFVLGWALRGLGRWEDGLESFRKAVEFGGGSGDTRNEMAICLMELGDFPAARKELEAALKEEPENTKIISNLGVLALKSGDDDQAAAFFRAVLELDPNDLIAANFFEGRL